MADDVRVRLQWDEGDVRTVTVHRGVLTLPVLAACAADDTGLPPAFAYRDGNDIVRVRTDADLAEALRLASGADDGHDGQTLTLLVRRATATPPTPLASSEPAGAAPARANSTSPGPVPPPPYDAVVAVPTARRAASGVSWRRHGPFAFLVDTYRVALDPFVQMGSIFASELAPALHRAWLTCASRGFASASAWQDRLGRFTMPQRVAFGSIAVVAVGWPLATVAHLSVSLIRPAIYLSWNLLLLRFAFSVVQRIAEPRAGISNAGSSPDDAEPRARR